MFQNDCVFIADGIKLNIPELDLEPDVDALLATPGMVEKLEQCVMNWQTQITIVMEEQLNKKPQVCHTLFFSRCLLAIAELLLMLEV